MHLTEQIVTKMHPLSQEKHC